MKTIKNTLTICLFLLLGSTNTYATSHETADKGFWTDSTVWVDGVVPNAISGDTFYINHPIVIEQDLILTSGAYVFISEDGGICGHHKAVVNNNAAIIVHGILEFDDLLVDKGYVHCYAGQVILTTSAKLTGTGAKLYVDSAGLMTVGTWFECVLPNYAFLQNTASTKDVFPDSEPSVYPNPFSDIVNIELGNTFLQQSTTEALVTVYDCMGKEVYQANLDNLRSDQLDLSFLAKGFYSLKVTNNQETYAIPIIKK